MATRGEQRQHSRSEERARLEDVAARLLAEKGYTATTVDEIVAEAGVSKPAFYRHFESKQHLHRLLLERHRDELAAAALSQLAARDGVLRLDLRRMIDAWFGYVEEHPYTWRMLFRDTTGDPEVHALHVELQRRQRAADVALLREFAPELPERELEPLGEAIRSSLTGVALWWLDQPEVPRDAVVGAMVRVVRGILLSAHPPRRLSRVGVDADESDRGVQ